MRRALVLLVALTLTSCVAPAQRGVTARATKTTAKAPHVIPVDASPRLVLDGMHCAGIADMRGDGVGVGLHLALVCAASDAMARNVCAHEYGHLLGLQHGDAGTWMAPKVSWADPLIPWPSWGELVAAKRSTESYVLLVDATVPTLLRDALAWAVDRWNAALGREAFTVRW